MFNLILQNLVPLITVFAIFINSVGGLFGVSAVIPYNPDRTDVVLSGEITTDVNKVLDCYNSAVKKTGFVIGTNKINIVGTPEFTISGLDSSTSVDIDAYWDALNGSSSYIFEVPGEGKITSADVKSAKMCESDGEKIIVINIKDYKHGLTDGENNPITNSFGFVTDMKESFSAAGIELADNCNAELSYTNATITCVVDERGKIIYGDWDIEADFDASDFTFTMLGNTFTCEELSYTMGYSIDI